ncbi:MAG: bifunctional aspartate kinase/homoserine dehydrogenase I [Candidatus Levybacteria bacterium]|nr:bifunctional aspartate kinase/homoserine dehydrogenase I [Candidatus Levybacteria bacterium]
MKVLKFGGTSVANAENISRVIEIIKKSNLQRERIAVVVSALGGVTDNLIELATVAAKGTGVYESRFINICKKHDSLIKDLIKSSNNKKVLRAVKRIYKQLKDVLLGISLVKELSPRSLDMVMSFGERFSAYIIAQAVNDRGIACMYIDASSIIKTDDAYGCANVDIQATYKNIADYFRNNRTLGIMGGFIASSHDGITTTLGRGGSDYTASLVGAALSASAIEIWTDVEGIMTADPRSVEDAFTVSEISYEEAGELAHFGAKVIHPKTMKPARLKNIPIYIKNTFNPNHFGTKISNDRAKNDFLITGISSLSDISLLQVQLENAKTIGEIAARLFDVLHRAGIEIMLTTQASSEQSISVAVHSKQAELAKKILEKAFTLELQTTQMSPISMERNLSIVAIVGGQMKGKPGIAGKLFNALGINSINVVAIAQGSSELNVSAVINKDDQTKALQVIHSAFFGKVEGTINLFLVGTGLIGTTLLKQIAGQKLPIRLCGVANSHSMLLNRQGVTIENWKEKLSKGTATNLNDFVSIMIKWNLPLSVFVDCTASEDAPSFYEQILNAHIAIVTPNKKANSGPLKRYQQLKHLAKKNRVPFFYGTNVGAGLPIIHTIQRLVANGDKIIKLEAVLSGSLSFIFNTFTQSRKPLSLVIRDAQKNGYTEPDPRDDLNGMDFARKILILARELGLEMKIDHIKVEPIFPKELFRQGLLEEFFEKVERLDKDFERRKLRAQKNKKVLRYIATLENGKAVIALREVNQDHPFYSLWGSDNIISIATKRYNTTPIVIKGAGAGAQVTAGNVLSDILSI